MDVEDEHFDLDQDSQDYDIRPEETPESSYLIKDETSSSISIQRMDTPKRIKRNNVSAVVDKTLVTLNKLTLNQIKIMNDSFRSSNAEFGRFVAKELDTIDDEELKNEARFQIHNILYSTKKQFINQSKQMIKVEDTFDK